MAGPYIEGDTLNLNVDWVAQHDLIPDGQLPVKIRTIYRPITMSPVMEVVFKSKSGSGVEAIPKLSDRRSGTDFRRGDAWTREAEAAWQDRVRQGKAPALFHHLEEKERRESAGIFEDSSSNDSDTPRKESASQTPRATRGNKAAQNEGRLQRTALLNFTTETTPYRKMKDLQARYVPSILAHISLSQASLDFVSEDQKHFKVPGILLQHIEGFNLSAGLASEVAREAWEPVVQHAVDAAKKINTCGVINLDCQPRNVVVKRSTLQPYLIDFAQCAFWEDYESDDQFAYYANSTDNQGAIGAVMPRKLKRENGVELKIQYEELECNFNPDDRVSTPQAITQGNFCPL